MVTVVLVDDHAIVRRALRVLLEQNGDIQVVGEAADGPEGLSLILRAAPDVALLDVTLPTLNGFGLSQELQLRACPTAVIFLTMHESVSYLLRAFEVGARGFLPKTTSEEDLLAAVRVVASGQSFVPPALAGALAAAYRRECGERGQVPEEFTSLTPREREVFDLVAQGRTTAEISRLLQISPHTAHHHRAAVMQKLHFHDRSAVVKYAMEHHLPLGMVGSDGREPPA